MNRYVQTMVKLSLVYVMFWGSNSSWADGAENAKAGRDGKNCSFLFDKEYYETLGYRVLSSDAVEQESNSSYSTVVHRVRNRVNSDRFRVFYKHCEEDGCVKDLYENTVVLDKHWGIVTSVGKCFITIETEIYNTWVEGRTNQFAKQYRAALAATLGIEMEHIPKFSGINRFSGVREVYE